MICIYDKDESNFNTNGLAVLEPEECLFKPAINGVWQLDMRLPYDAEHKSDLIENDRILKVTGLDCVTEQTGAYQLFRIYDFKKEDNSVSVIAFPIGLDARFDTFTESMKLYDKTPAQAVSAINMWIASLDLDHQDYVVSLESPQYWDNTQKSSEYTRANLISILNGEKSFVQTWGGEICYDNYNIRMEHHMGTYTPVDVRYGKNILGMSYDLDASNVVTRLYPKAKSGEILNGDTRYRLTYYNYVDAPGSAVYPIPHIYAVDTPYNLVQLTDDGSAEYGESWAAYTAIRDITKFWIYNALTGTAGVDTEPLLDNIELGWLVNNYGLTMVNDKVQGVVEYFWRKVINNNTHPVLNGSVQSLIYQAMKAGFDEVLTNTQSGSYIGSTSKKMWETGFEQKFYSYTWDSAGEFRVNVLGEADYAWVYASSKWQQLDNDGYTTGATDKTKWKWYKVKGKTYKRYGNKKKGRYLKDQWWCINDVWYKFTSGGQGIKGDALMSDCLDLIEAMEVQEATLVDSLVEAAYTAERSLLELLYNQMTDYCEVLFDTDKLAYPAINIDINFVDLSKTTEYANYEFLEKIHLGDAVNVRNDKLGIETLSERIVGLTYDVLRGCNTEIRIGLTESSVVNLLDSIGKTDNQTKYVAGDGITIENNVIKVNPPETPYLEDVIVNGASVVRNHKAYVDLEEMGIGLQWFEEQEESLYGMETQVDALAENPKFYVDHPVTMHIDNTGLYGSKYNYYFKSMNTDSSVIACGYQGVKINTMYSPPEYDDGFLVISKDQSTAGFEYWNNDVTHQTYSWSSTTETRQQLDRTTCEGYGMSTTFSYEGETYYAVLSCSDYRAVWTKQYEVDGVVGWNADYGAIGEFETMADFCKAILEANISVDKYNGLARDEKLAFFAGAEDENGTNATVAIWTDGKVKGLVADVQKNGESVVDENGVASIPDSASSVAELTDVELTDLADKEILEWDAEAEKWKNVANSGGGGGNALILDAQIYSTEEKQVGVWIDNKPLYAKTFDITPIIISTSGTIISEIDISAMQVIVNGYGVSQTYGQMTSLALYNDNGLKAVSDITIQVDKIVMFYTKTADRAGSGGYQAYGFSPIIYSEEEREVGVWIDNKPLYQKTIHTTSTTINSNVDVDITALNIENLVDFFGIYDRKDAQGGTEWYELNNWSSNSTYWAWWQYSNGIISYSVHMYRTEHTENQYFNLLYTKTTDVAGSGSYNTLGVPTVHIDNTEKVVGTYFGKPLYEKTWQLTIPNGSGVQNFTEASIPDLKSAIFTSYSIADGGNTSETPWYPNAGLYFAGQSASGVSFYFNSNYWNGQSLIYTCRYTKTTD